MKGTRERYGAIIDVHSGSVGMAIVDLNPAEQKPTVVYMHREYLQITERPTAESLMRSLRNALIAGAAVFAQSGKKTLKTYDPKADVHRLLLVCGAPWARTATRFIKAEHPNEPFIVTKSSIQTLISEAEKKDQEEFKTTELLKEMAVSLVERSVINVSLNGYPTTHPYGKEATEITLAHISGLLPTKILEAVDAIDDQMLLRPIRTSHTFALTLFCVLRDLYPKTRHALIIDISAEATEISVMQDEVLLESHVMLYGTHTFIRDVAEALHTLPDEALTHIKECDQHTAEHIRLAIGSVTEGYIARLHESYATLKKKYLLPRHLFLSTSKGLDVFFEKIIRQGSLDVMGERGSLVSLNLLLKEAHGKSTAPFDIFFAIESRFFHKLHGCGELDV